LVAKDSKLFHLEDLRFLVDPILADLQSRGRKVYLVGVGGSMVEGSMTRPLGALAYLHAFLEFVEQARAQNLTFERLVVTSGSASTQAGLVAGARLLCPDMEVIGISVTVSTEWMGPWVLNLARALLEMLDLPMEIGSDRVLVHDGFMGRGYGLLDPVTLDAVGLTASLEGVLLDPVYSGKGMAGLIDMAHKGRFTSGNTLFWHTGGTPALFAYGPDVCLS
jgi:D-cysteine desulfhydrase/L-cysteate sulfo-lyase